MNEPFKLSENPSIDESYFYWYFTKSYNPFVFLLKIILLPSTLVFFMVISIMGE